MMDPGSFKPDEIDTFRLIRQIQDLFDHTIHLRNKKLIINTVPDCIKYMDIYRLIQSFDHDVHIACRRVRIDQQFYLLPVFSEAS
jgi:hypothetical protein